MHVPLLTFDQRDLVLTALKEAAVLPCHRAALDQVLPVVVCGPEGSPQVQAAYMNMLLRMGDEAVRGAVELLCRVLLGSIVPTSGFIAGAGLDTQDLEELTLEVLQLELQGDSDQAWEVMLGLPPLNRVTFVAALAMLLNSHAAKSEAIDPPSPA